jgi:hypothetical protein
MKRERIAAPEAQMTDDALLPLVDQMLEQRRKGVEEVNEMFGTDWSVELAGAWLKEHMDQAVPGVDFDSDNDEQIDEEEGGEVDKSVDNVDVDNMDDTVDSIDEPTGSDMEDEENIESIEDPEVSEDKQVEINVEINVDTTEDTEDGGEDQPEDVEEDNEDEEKID